MSLTVVVYVNMYLLFFMLLFLQAMVHACNLPSGSLSMISVLVDKYFSVPMEKHDSDIVREALLNVCKKKHVDAAEIAKKLIDGVLVSNDKKHKAKMLEFLRHIEKDTGNTCIMLACTSGNLDLLATLLAALTRCCNQVQSILLLFKLILLLR
jgi:hypothetical protein